MPVNPREVGVSELAPGVVEVKVQTHHPLTGEGISEAMEAIEGSTSDYGVVVVQLIRVRGACPHCKRNHYASG